MDKAEVESIHNKKMQELKGPQLDVPKLRERIEQYELIVDRAAKLAGIIGFDTAWSNEDELPRRYEGPLSPPLTLAYGASNPVCLDELDAKTPSGAKAYSFLEIHSETIEEKVVAAQLLIGGRGTPPAKKDVFELEVELWTGSADGNERIEIEDYLLKGVSAMFGRYVDLSDEEFLQKYNDPATVFELYEEEAQEVEGLLDEVELRLEDPVIPKG